MCMFFQVVYFNFAIWLKRSKPKLPVCTSYSVQTAIFTPNISKNIGYSQGY